MENRRKLHESGVVLIIIGILNLFMFIATVIESIVDGTVAAGLANVEADILGAVKVGMIIFCVIMALLVAADILLGVKAIMVSKKPTANRGYIILAFVFCIISAIGIISNAISVFSGNGAIIDSSLNIGSSALSVWVYSWFIGNAEAVRKDVLNETK